MHDGLSGNGRKNTTTKDEEEEEDHKEYEFVD